MAQVLEGLSNDKTRAAALIARDELDDAVEVLKTRADNGDFDIMGIRPFAFYAGLEGHPKYPGLLARAEDWRRQEYANYQSLQPAERSTPAGRTP